MGIILGYISLLCLLILLGKYLARKSKNIVVNNFFRKTHKVVSAVFFISFMVHLIVVFPIIANRGFQVIVTGFLLAGVAIILVITCHTIKDSKKRMTLHRAFSVILLVLVAFHMITYMADFSSYQKSIREIQIQEVDLSSLADGDYIGECDAGYIRVKVLVTIKEHQIETIQILEHKNECGKSAEQIVKSILDIQRIDVDAITSATNSSRVIQKAIENALKNDLQ